MPRRVDIALAQDVAALGGRIYWTHGAGYLRVRHGDEHTWTVDDSHFLGRASDARDGCDFAFAGIAAPERPPSTTALEPSRITLFCWGCSWSSRRSHL